MNTLYRCPICDSLAVVLQGPQEIGPFPPPLPYFSRLRCTNPQCGHTFDKILADLVPEEDRWWTGGYKAREREALIKEIWGLGYGRGVEIDGCIVSRCGPAMIEQTGKIFQAVLRVDWEAWRGEHPNTLWMPEGCKAFGDTPEEAIEAIKVKRGILK